MRIDLSGKSALVSGSTAGIGFAIARGLAESGAGVIVNGRSDGRVKDAVEKILIELPHANVSGIAADAGTKEGVASLLEQAPDVDILVNNVGTFTPHAFVDISDEDWQEIFDVNVMSGVRLSRHHAPRMVEKGWGRIVFISSESAVQIPAEMVHYGMTKTAQLAVARGLAETYPGTGLTVNSVLPGPTSSEGVTKFISDMATHRGKSVEEVEAGFIENERPSSLLGRLITPEEVANMVVYVCSEQSAATNGAALRVDGGVVRAIP